MKYVNDLIVMEVVPRSAPSVMESIVNSIQAFALQNNVRLSMQRNDGGFLAL